MKTLNLTKVALTVVVATQLLSAEAFAGSKLKETLLTSRKEAIQDPYFQIKSRSVVELTDEEAMEFINENPGLETKALNIPNIPPRPPEAGNIVAPGTNRDSGLVSAGAGGTAGPTPSPTGALDSIIMVVDKLIAIGQKIIPTIEKGKAVVTNSSMAAVSVLPRLETINPVVHDMGNWSLPVTKHYKIVYKNGLGSDVVSFIYSISYQHSGTYGGKGKYLTGIRASARSINIAWGFDLDASSQLVQISNVGTVHKVVAGATIEIQYTVKNWTRTITNVVSYFIAGDNRLYKLD
jgi:hypothetical protein